MEDNKVFNAFKKQVSNSIDEIEKKITIDTDVDGAIGEIEKLLQKVKDTEVQLESLGGESYSKKIQESFAQARVVISEYATQINTLANQMNLEDKFDISTITTKTSVVFEMLKNTLNSLTTQLDGTVKDVSTSLEELVRVFEGQLGKTGASAAKLKENLAAHLQLSDITDVGSGIDISGIDQKLDEIISKVTSAKEKVTNVVTEMFEARNVNPEAIKNVFSSFVTELEEMGNDVLEVTGNINGKFNESMNELSSAVSKETIVSLEQFSNVFKSLNDNNTTGDGISKIVESLKQLGNSDVELVNNLSSVLTQMLNIQSNPNGTVAGMTDLSGSMDSMRNMLNDTLKSYQDFLNVLGNNQGLENFKNQVEEIINKFENLTNMMQSNMRVNAFKQKVLPDLTHDDYDRADNKYVNRVVKQNSRNYVQDEVKLMDLRSAVSNAQSANIAGGMPRELSHGNMPTYKLDKIEDLAREYQTEMTKINSARKDFDKAAKDPENQDEARGMLEIMNQHKSKLNNLGKQLASAGKMSNSELKYAPKEVKQVHDSIEDLLQSGKASNNDFVQLNKQFGLDELNEQLIKSNKEFEKLSNTKWDNFTNGISKAKKEITGLMEPLTKIGDTVSGLAKGGMGVMGLGSLGALASNPFSLSGIGSIVGKLAGDMFQADVTQGRTRMDMRQSEMMQYGSGAANNINDVMSRGLQMQYNTSGLINYQDLAGTYAGLSKSVVGQYGQADKLAQKDMLDLSDTSLMLQKGYGLGEGQVNSALNTFYKELGMDVKETEYQLAKIAQTSQALNVPMGTHLETVTSLAEQYRSMGFEADYATNVIGNLMFQHNMTYSDATSMAQTAAGAVNNQPSAWYAYMGAVNGDYADPLQAVVDLKYGYGADGKPKEGVIDKKVDYFQDRLNMMSMFGGSAGEYAVGTELNNMGFSDKQAGMILDAYRNGNTEYVTKMFEEQMVGDGASAAGEPGVDKNDPDKYFENILSKMTQTADEYMSTTEKILNRYDYHIQTIVNNNQELFDSFEDEMLGLVDALMYGVGDFVSNLGDWIEKIKGIIDGLEGYGVGLTDVLKYAAMAFGVYKVAQIGTKVAKTVSNKKNKNKTGSGSGSGDDDDAGKKKTSSKSGKSGTGDLDDLAGNNKTSVKKMLKTGGKAGLIVGGASLLGGMLFGGGDEAEASGYGSIDDLLAGQNNNLDLGDPGSEAAVESSKTLKDIYNLLAGNGPADGSNGSGTGGGESSTGTSGGLFSGVDLETVGVMAGIGAGAGMLYSGYKQNKTSTSGAAGNKTQTTEEKNKTARQAVVDAEEAERKARVKQDYDLNRAAGQSAAEAKRNADATEKLRSSSAFNRMTQADYEDLFKNSKTGTVSNLLKKTGSIAKKIPVVGTAATVGLGAWELDGRFDDINTMTQITGGTGGKAKGNAVGDVGLSTALMTAGGVVGSIVPVGGTFTGMAVGAGLGMGLDWLGDKTGANDWLLSKFGIGGKDAEKSIATNAQRKSASEYADRMKALGYANVNDNSALIATSAIEKNSSYLSGMSTEQKDVWGAKFTETYLSKIAEGVDPGKAEKLAKEQADKLTELKLSQDDLNDVNQNQLSSMLQLYELTGANKDVLDEYRKNYFKREADAKAVLDATSASTGLSLTELEEIAASMNLLPEQLAALIAINSGGSDRESIEKSFVTDKEIENMRAMLKTANSSWSSKTIEETIAHMVDNSSNLAAKGLSKREIDSYAQYYAGAHGSGMKEKDSVAYAEQQVLYERQADQVLNGKGLMDSISSWQKKVGNTGLSAIASTITKDQIKDAISTTAAASGLSETEVKSGLKRKGINEKAYTGYLLQYVDGVNGASTKQGKIGKTEISKFLGNASDAKGFTDVISKLSGTSEKEISTMQKNQEELQKTVTEQVHSSQKNASGLAADMQKTSTELQGDSKKYSSLLQESDQEFRNKLQDAKKKADSENTTSVVDSIGALGSLIGSKIGDLSSSLFSLIGGGSGGGGSSSGSFIQQVAELIGAGEGNFGTVTKNDNGALSIGKMQWHGNRARDLLKSIKDSNPDVYNSYLKGTGLKSLTSDWSNYTLNSNQADAISSLLSSSVGIEAQNSLIERDVNSYIEKGKSLGITDPQALAYFADLYNQSPARAVSIAKNSDKTLSGLHKAAMSDGVMSKYSTRRKNAYSAAQNISDSYDAGGTGLMSEKDAANWYYDQYNVTSKFGVKEGFRKSAHQGVDFDGKMGDAIKAISGGKVIKVVSNKKAKDGSGLGNQVQIQHADGSVATYGHLQNVHVKEGQTVKSGAQIGTMGNTGSVYSSGGGDGSHLHLGYKKAFSDSYSDPEAWLKKLTGSSTIKTIFGFDAGGTSLIDSIDGVTNAINNSTKDTTDAITASASKLIDSVEQVQNPTRGRLTNISAYDPFSGIHPNDGLNYNKYQFDLYEQLGSKGISYNEAGINLQQLSEKARNAFDLSIKTSVDPTQHPNFTQLVDKHMRVAVANAVSEATRELDGNYAQQFSALWQNSLNSALKNSSID